MSGGGWEFGSDGCAGFLIFSIPLHGGEEGNGVEVGLGVGGKLPPTSLQECSTVRLVHLVHDSNLPTFKPTQRIHTRTFDLLLTSISSLRNIMAMVGRSAD